MAAPFKKQQTADRDLQFVQDNVAAALPQPTTIRTLGTDASGKQTVVDQTGSTPFSGGVLIRTALVAGQDNLLPHGLNRIPIICINSGTNVQATLWQPATSSLKDANGNSLSATASFINVWCSANCSAAILVN